MAHVREPIIIGILVRLFEQRFKTAKSFIQKRNAWQLFSMTIIFGIKILSDGINYSSKMKYEKTYMFSEI